MTVLHSDTLGYSAAQRDADFGMNSAAGLHVVHHTLCTPDIQLKT